MTSSDGNRLAFLKALGGGGVSLAVLSACGNNIPRPSTSLNSWQLANSPGIIPALSDAEFQTLMRRNGILAVTQYGQTVIRDDVAANPSLRSQIRIARRAAVIIPPQTGGNSGSGSAGGKSSGSNNCDKVGDTCDGLTVISVESTSAGTTNLMYQGSGDTSVVQVKAGPWVGPIYTFKKFTMCLEDELTSIKDELINLASAILNAGGAGVDRLAWTLPHWRRKVHHGQKAPPVLPDGVPA